MNHYRRVPSQMRSEEKLLLVLATAQRIVITEGAEAATTTRLAEESGVSVGTIYRYFKSREGVLNALVARELDELDRRLDEGGYFLGGADWKERADAGADIMIEFADDPSVAYRALMYTSTLTGEIVATNREHDLRMAHHLLRGLPESTRQRMGAVPLNVIHMYLGILDKGMELAFFKPGERNDEVIRQMKVAARGYLAVYFTH